jgi:Acetyltransferase (GNAT) domain
MKWSVVQAVAETGNPLMEQLVSMARREPTSPFLHSDFLREVLVAQPDSPATMALAVQESGAPPVMAVLLSRSRFGVWNAYTTPQMPMSYFSGRPLRLEAADLEGLFAALPGFAWLIRFQRFDESYLPAMGGPLERQIERIDLHQTVCVEVTGTFDDYWSARSASLRRSIRSALARLEARQLEVRLAVLRAPDEMIDAVRGHGELEARSWKGAAGTSLAQSESDRQFYERVMCSFARNSSAVAFQLFLDGQLAASELALIDAGTLVLLKTAYREDLSEFSPGRLLDHLAFQTVFHDRMASRIEYSTKATEDDRRWATHVRTIRQLNVFRFGALKMLIVRLKPMAAAIRQWRHRLPARLPRGGEARQ